MSAFQIFTQPSQQALDTAANVLSGATLTFTLTGTTTPTNAYSDSALTTPLANPLAANSAGVWAPIFLDPSVQYRIVLKSASGVTLQTWDPANENVFSQAIIGGYLYPRTAAEIAAAVTPVSYAYPPYNAFRYLTSAQIADVLAGSLNLDVTTGLQNWLNCCTAQTATLPAGKYLISSMLTAPNGVYIIGDGREASYLYYTSSTTITGGAMLKFPSRSAFRVSSIGFRCTNAVIGNTTVQLQLENCVYWELDNISCGGLGASAGTNSLKGIYCNQTSAGFIPPLGSGVIRDFLYVVEPTNSGASGSRGIHIQGHASQAIEFVTLMGEGNVEHAYYGVHFENAANCRIESWQMRGATNTEIVLTNGDNILIIGAMLAPAPTTGTGISIDSNSFDNLVLNPSWNFSSGTPAASLTDNGVRTSVIAPGAVSTLTPRGKLFGSVTISDLDTVASQNGTLEIQKPAANDHNVVVVRDSGVAPTGTKAFVKIERGGDSRDLIRADINGTNYFAVTAGGDVGLSNSGSKVGFFGSAGTTKPTVTGSRGGNAALASLLTALANMGLLTDSST